MPTTIVVPQGRPPVPAYARTWWKTEVQALVMQQFGDIAAHLAGVKFRLAAHRFVDWDVPGSDTILELAPTVGPHTHRVWWESSPFATHVGVIIGYQAFAASGAPTITGTLKKRDGADIDADGVLWSTADGSLVEASEFVRNDPGPVAVYRYPILYAHSTGRVVAPGAIAGQTAPRLFNVGVEAGNPVMIELEVERARVHLIVGFEAIFETITQ